MNRQGMGCRGVVLLALGVLMLGVGFTSPAFAQDAEGFVTEKLPALRHQPNKLKRARESTLRNACGAMELMAQATVQGPIVYGQGHVTSMPGTFKIRHTASGELPLDRCRFASNRDTWFARFGYAILGRHSE